MTCFDSRPWRAYGLALAVVGTWALPCGGAAAQSNITLFGVADVALMRVSGSIAAKTQIASGNQQGSRLGIRGSEDLGGGLRANFWLEAGVLVDDGQGQRTNPNNQPAAPAVGAQGLAFNRTSFVGLSGPWGILRAGRDYTPTFMVHTAFDPSGSVGLLTSQASLGSLTVFAVPSGVRASNSLAYGTPTFHGFSASAMLALGENASDAGATRDDGNYEGLRLAYADGPLSAAAAHARYHNSAVRDIKETVAGASYSIGNTKLGGTMVLSRHGAGRRARGELLAVTHRAGAAEFKLSWSRSRARDAMGIPAGSSSKIGMGVAYNLSTRTALYTSVAHVRNGDGAAALPLPGSAATGANRSAQGYEVGLRHTF